MALALLLRDWCLGTGRELHALIVDHALRPESTTEAETVRVRLADLGIAATVLRRSGPRPASAIQETARRDRYDLMAAACRQLCASVLCTGHHADDQAATVVMRALRGSGVDGLGAMRADSNRDGLRLVRPLLGIRKHVLVDWLDMLAVPYVRDPSNDSAAFTRNRVDRWLEGLPADSHGVERLARLADRAARAGDALEAWTGRIATEHLAADRFGVWRLSLKAWQDAPDEIRLRLLLRLATLAGGRAPGLEAAEAALDDPAGRTLGRAVMRLQGDRLVAYRERRNLPVPANLDAGGTWDNRFVVRLAAPVATPLAIGPATGVDTVDLPALARTAGCLADPATLPGLFDGKRLVAVPHFGWKAADFAGSATVRLTL